jgi:DNA-binding protein HU-beta
MNKKDLTNELLKVLSTRKEATDAIDRTFTSMRNALRRNEKVVISGFGSFNVKLAPARKCRVPRTENYVSVPAKPKVRFKPSKELMSDK